MKKKSKKLSFEELEAMKDRGESVSKHFTKNAKISVADEKTQLREAIDMKWKDPTKELPKEGEIVGVIYSHWKENKPMSYQMMFGEVEYDNSGNNVRVNSMDFTGQGCWAVSLLENEDFPSDDVAFAWIHASDFELPPWAPSDPHWIKR